MEYIFWARFICADDDASNTTRPMTTDKNVFYFLLELKNHKKDSNDELCSLRSASEVRNTQ